MGIRVSENLYSKYGEPSLDLVFTQSNNGLKNVIDNGAVEVEFSRTQDTQASYYKSDGTIGYASTDVPRFDHDPTTGESLGLLIEESRTNLFLNSEDFTTTWTTNISVGSANVVSNTDVSPDGTTTADTLNFVGAANARLQQPVALTSGTTYTASVWVKFLSGANAFTIWVPNGADPPNQSDTFIATSSWQRFAFTFTASTTGSVFIRIVQGSGGDQSFAVWGAQLEAGAFPTSYIPTSGSTSTRGADSASITGAGFSSFYNQSEGTWFVNYEATFGKEDTTVFTFNASNNNRVFSYTAPNYVQFQYGGPFVYSNTATTTNDYVKAVMFYESDGTFGGSFEGTAVVSATGTSNTATELNLAPFTGAGGALQSSTSHISRLTYWPRRLPDSDLQSLTQ